MKQIVLSLLLVFASAVNAQNVNSLDPTQVYNTGNLTTFNQNGSQTTTPWQNVGQWGGQLQCWAPGNPGYCGPNPYVNANGQGVINFSYGYTDLHQVVNIANALPNSGTGLRVNGFNFGFMAKNGNGWDNGQQDYLVAYVNFYDNKGQLAQNYNYGAQTNQKYNWTQFNFSETFTTPYASKDLSTARYGFVGYDTNFWAGPYGPEIYNVSFSLKYSVDPCYTNVLSSPSCPGYMEALAKLNPAPSPIEPVNTQTNNTIIEPLPPTTVSTANTNTNNTNPTLTNQVTTSSTSPTTTTTATISTPSGSGKESTSNGTSIGLSVVARNQQREQAIAMQAAQSAVAAADQVATQTQQDALNVAALSSSNSLTFALGNTRSPAMNSQVQSNNSTISQQTQINTSSQSIFSLMPPSMVTANNNQSTQQNLSVMPSVSQTFVNSNIQPTSITFNEALNMDTQKLLTDRTNPLNQVLENKPIEPQVATNSLQGSTVNRNVQNNELAGGVDLTRIAQAPTGYNEYLNFTLRDAAFYAPKEVYKNQRVIDNTRVLRQLSSDRLHQEMVEQQYRR